MKTLIRLFFLVALNISYLLVNAQVAVGFKGGLNLSNLKVDDPQTTYHSRVGYHAGPFFRGRFSNVAVQTEALLLTQVSKGIQPTIVGEYKDSFTYLSIPVLIKYYVFSGLNIHMGPQFGILLDAERNGTDLLGQTFSIQTKNSYYKNNDIQVSLGGGWDFPFGLQVDVRYNLGIKDINNQLQGEEVKSRVFLVSLGWNFLR
jgi:hypothetical protein